MAAGRLFAAVIVCVLVPAFAIALADRYARDTVTEHERVIANDIVASVDRILDGARLRHVDELTALVGRPCPAVFRTLAEIGTRLRYLRAVALVHEGRVMCSSALGAIDLPLGAYTHEPEPGSTLVTLLRQTPFQQGIPVLPVFYATAPGAGCST